MNFFFLCDGPDLRSRLQIPKFQNQGRLSRDIRLYRALIKSESWLLEKVSAREDQHFFYIDSGEQPKDAIFFLAQPKRIGTDRVYVKELTAFDSFTKTTPDYRANLSVYTTQGGFSSYQSEYPMGMVGKRGSIVSSLAALSNKGFKSNKILIRNIHAKPSREAFPAFIVCREKKQVLHTFQFQSNSLCSVDLSNKEYGKNAYLITSGHLGIPIYLSTDKTGNISFEHTHPPHSYIDGAAKFDRTKRLKDELGQIIIASDI